MKKLAALLAMVLCALLFTSCSANPYQEFDPDGVISKKRIGMSESDLKKADSALSYKTSTSSDNKTLRYYHKDGKGYSISYYITDGEVDSAIYAFPTVSSQSEYLDDVESYYTKIGKAFGKPTNNSYPGSEFTADNLEATNQLSGVVIWNTKDKYKVSMVYLYSSGQGLIMLSYTSGT